MTEEKTIDLPLQTRADVRLQPETIDSEARTVEAVWSTGAPVRRRDPWTGKRYDEILSLDPVHVDLSRLNAGAPLLNAHGAFDLGNVIGVVERAWIARANGAFEGRAVVRFSAREDVEPLWQDVRAGIIRHVSVGYAVRAYAVSEPDGEVPLWRAIDWQPVELSAVPMGADGGAGFRHGQRLTPCRLIHRAAAAHQPENQAMDQPLPAAETRAAETPHVTGEDPVTRDTAETTVTVTPDASAAAEQPAPADGAASERTDHPHHPDRVANPTAAAEDIARRVVAEERTRIAGIYDAARKLGIEPAVADDLVRRGMSLD